MVGIDYSFMFTTLYLYLEKMVKTPNPRLYYGLIVGAYSLSSTLFGVVCGRWVDRTRRIKLYTIATLVVQVVGCILYVIHFSVAFPLIGRFIGGLGDPFPSVSSGEVIRIYDKEGSTRALWWLASVYSFGFMIGPVMILFFKHVDFYIGSVHVTQLNVIALFMAALLLLTIVVAHFLIHDCSAEIDLKEYLKQQETQPDKTNKRPVKRVYHVPTEETHLLVSDDYQNSENSSDEFMTIPINIIIRYLLKHPDAVLMFVSTFVFMYGLFSADVLFPLLTIDVLDWSLTTLTWLLIIYSLVYFALLMVMSKYCTGSRGVYIMSIVCIVFNIILFLSMTGMKMFSRNKPRDVVLMICFIISYAFGWVIEEVIVRCMLAKMVPSHCQSFTESCRNAVSRSSTIFASVSAPLVLPFLEWWSTGLLIAISLHLLLFVIRRHSLLDISEIYFPIGGKRNIQT